MKINILLAIGNSRLASATSWNCLDMLWRGAQEIEVRLLYAGVSVLQIKLLQAHMDNQVEWNAAALDIISVLYSSLKSQLGSRKCRLDVENNDVRARAAQTQRRDEGKA